MALFYGKKTLMQWNVYFSKWAKKQTKKMPVKIKLVLALLIEDLQENGPFPGEGWPNYSKLKGQESDIRHCHLVRGNQRRFVVGKLLR
jgi:mRNA-degrading endonuclease RelE of RelBE toxin-antitoxin system